MFQFLIPSPLVIGPSTCKQKIRKVISSPPPLACIEMNLMFTTFDQHFCVACLNLSAVISHTPPTNRPLIGPPDEVDKRKFKVWQ